MKSLGLGPVRVLVVLIGACVVGFSLWVAAGEGLQVTLERRTPLGPLMPLREPTVEEFLQEGGSAPYAALDETVTLDLSQNPDTQISLVNGRLTIAYSDGLPNRQVKLWHDDGRGGGTAGDALANGSEIRVVDSLQLFWYFSLAAVSVQEVNGLVAVTYAACLADDCPGEDLKLWYDDGRGGGTAGDVVVNGGELRTLTAGFEAGGEIRERGGRLLVLWKESSTLRLWADDGTGGGTAGDGLINGSEMRTLNVTADPQIGNGKTITNVGGSLAVAYWQLVPLPDATLRVWVDDGAGGGVAGDLVVNGAENRVLTSFHHPVDWWTTVAWVDGQLAISFQLAGSDKDLYFFYDDGGTAGDGVAGDLVDSPTEFRRLLNDGDVGVFSDITQLGGRVSVTSQYIIPPQLKMFYDDGNDGAVAGDAAAFGTAPGEVDPLEARGIDQPLGGGGFGGSAIVFDPDVGDPSSCEQVAVSHFNRCNTCGYQNDVALHLTTVNALAPRGLFVHDTGDHQFHDPVATQPEIDLTLRWFQDGADEGEVLISGDVTGPNAGVWLTLQENIVGWQDFMIVSVDLVPGGGEKTIFMSFRNGICDGNTTVRTVTLDVLVPDPTNLTLAGTAGVNEAVMDWDDVTDPVLDGYNVYRASNLDILTPGSAPTGWTLLTGSPLPAGSSAYTDTTAALGGGVELYYFYVTALDSVGNESTNPPN